MHMHEGGDIPFIARMCARARKGRNNSAATRADLIAIQERNLDSADVRVLL